MHVCVSVRACGVDGARLCNFDPLSLTVTSSHLLVQGGGHSWDGCLLCESMHEHQAHPTVPCSVGEADVHMVSSGVWCQEHMRDASYVLLVVRVAAWR